MVAARALAVDAAGSWATQRMRPYERCGRDWPPSPNSDCLPDRARWGIIGGVIFHICTDEQWQRARIAGRYTPEALAADGFVHCSDPGTVHLPANHLYPARGDLVLLQIDPARLQVPVRWEPGIAEDPAGPWFPHIYGSINIDAIVAVHPFRPNAGGRFTPVQPDPVRPA